MNIKPKALSPSERQIAIVRDPLTIRAEAQVIDAVAEMSNARITCLSIVSFPVIKEELHANARSSCIFVVNDQNQPVGILTDRDIVRLTSYTTNFQNCSVQEVMTTPLVTLPDPKLTDLFLAVTLMQSYQIRHLPLVDAEGALTGVVTHETLRHASSPTDLLRFRRVHEVMTTEVITASSEDSITYVSGLMARDRVSCVVIVEPLQGSEAAIEPSAITTKPMIQPIGILTEQDIVQFHALALDPQTYTTRQVMHVSTISVQPSDPLPIVRERMEYHRLACLTVTGTQGELVGLITQSDLLALINPAEIHRINELLEQRVYQLEADKMSLLQVRTSELEQQLQDRIKALQAKADREALLIELSKQIRASLNVRNVLETAVQEVKALLHCDRVTICRLTVQNGTESLELIDGPEQAAHVSLPEAGLDQAWLQHYAGGEQYIGVRLVQGQDCPPKIDPVAEGVGTKVVMPILVDEHLWGLLVASERSQSRHWDVGELEFLDRLVVQIAIAIQQATAYEQLQMELNERRQAEIWWHESERRYHSLAESVPVGIFRVSVQGHIQYINQRCLDLLSLNRSQIQHNTWVHRIHPADRQRIEEAHDRLRLNGTPFQEEYRLQYEDGTIRWVSGQVVPSFDEMGCLQSYTGSIVDIHERKQAELSLQVVNQALEDRVAERTRELSTLTTLQGAIFNGTNYSIIATDPDGIIVQMNSAAEQLLGYRSIEVVAQQSLDLFHDPEDLLTHAAELSAQYDRTIEPGFEVLALHAQCSTMNECECRYRSKTGDRIPVAVSMTALSGEDGELLGFVAIARNLSEHQKAEAKLRRLSERLSLAITAGQLGIWDWDILNDHLEWNDRMYELYGVTRDSSQSQYETWAKRLHPDDLDRCTQLIDAAVAGDCEFEAEFRLIQPDGSLRYIQSFSNTTRDANGRAIRMIGLNLDITDRRRTEQQLQAQAQRERLLRKIAERIRRSLELQEIFDVAAEEVRHYLNVDRVGIFRLNEVGQSSDGHFVAESITEGYPSLLSIAIDDPCFNTHKCTMYDNGAIQAIADIHAASLDPCYHRMLDKLQIRANLVIPLLLHNGCVWGLLCIHKCNSPRPWSVSDIDFAEQIGSQLSIAVRQASLFQQLQQQLAEQKVKEEALQQQLTAIEASVDGIAILQNDVYIYINQAHVQLFGYRNADEMLGQTWEMLYSAEEKARFEREVFPVLGAQGQWKGEALARHVNGHHFYEELSLTLSGNGFLICVCRDISDRKHNEQALQQANLELARATRHKDEFLANMSHELRTPLNAILGMTEGLQEGMLGDLTDEQNKALQVVERGGRHLLDLINDILDLAKIEAGHVDLQYTTAPLAPLCQASTSFVRQQAMKKSIALNVQTPTQDLNIQLDERRIRQVLINLLNNAVKFTPEGGTITLEVTVIDRKEAEAIILTHPLPSQTNDRRFRPSPPHQPENQPQNQPQNQPENQPENQPQKLSDHPQWLRFRVIDTGIGIAPENIDRLFRPFSQIDSALNRHYSGTGLGLALIKHIAELHGGAVGVQSQVGVGSEFWMLIPLLIEANPEAIAIPDDQPPSQISTLPTDQPAPLILLAEDNIGNILTMGNYLKAKGFRIIVAKDGQEAIAVTQSQIVDLILMDIQIPTIDGLEAMKRIRQNPNYATVPIVAVTALTMGGDRERCLNAGADDYLSKPVQLKQLVHTIQNLLGRVEVQA
jgi:PAS domain S-box-containing protein